MVDILYKQGKDYPYWSKADAFILPLTGIKKELNYPVKSYLFWKEHTIEDYKLIVAVHYKSYDDCIQWCQNYLFPLLDKKGYLLESYDGKDKIIFILNMAEWAMDIEQFLAGRYSLLTKEAKGLIQKYHTSAANTIPIHIYTVINPNLKMDKLKEDGKAQTPIEHAAKYYEWNLSDLQKIGEIGSTFNVMEETLITDIGCLIS